MMEPKLLTEARWHQMLEASASEIEKNLAELRERGLIAPEPVDPLLIEAREVCAKHFEEKGLTGVALEYRNGGNDKEGDAGESELPIALAALGEQQ